MAGEPRIRGVDLLAFWAAWPPGEDWYYDDGLEIEGAEGEFLVAAEDLIARSDLGWILWQGAGDPPQIAGLSGLAQSHDLTAIPLPVWFDAWMKSQTEKSFVVTVPIGQDWLEVRVGEYKWQFFHRVSTRVSYLDHRLVPEVRACLAAMMSRQPAGGIEARYREMVDAVADELYEASEFKVQYDPVVKRWKGWQPGSPTHTAYFRQLAEDQLTHYPLPPKVQAFFDQNVGKYGHCYDAETEVLCRVGTWIGWMSWPNANRWSDVDGEPPVELGVYDPELDEIRFERPTQWIEKPFKGQMYKVRTRSGNVDLVVTPEHRMFVQRREGEIVDGVYRQTWGEFRIVTASELASKAMTRYRRVASRMLSNEDDPATTSEVDPWGLANVNLGYDFGRLCGFFVGDGYAGGKQAGYLSFNLKKRRKIDYFRSVLGALEVTLIGTGGKLHAHLTGARDWARSNFYDDNGVKKIPSWVFSMTASFRRGFMDGLKNSDGHAVTEESWSYSSTSRNVIDGLQILGMGLEMPVSFYGPSGKGVYSAYVSSYEYANPTVNHHHPDDGWVDYEGLVYCATVSTGLLAVRRNGAPIISGNSSIQELTGEPVVFVENISRWFAYLTFDNPLVAGQEMSTRAIWRENWAMGDDVSFLGDSLIVDETSEYGKNFIALREYHDLGLAIARAEIEAWKVELQERCPDCGDEGGVAFDGIAADGVSHEAGWAPCKLCEGTGKKYPWMKDPQPFRPAFDRARWALPGTVATGVVHTANLRVMARVMRLLEDYAAVSGNAEALAIVEEVKAAYRLALPGLAGLGLREAVYDVAKAKIPTHLAFWEWTEDMGEAGREPWWADSAGNDAEWGEDPIVSVVEDESPYHAPYTRDPNTYADPIHNWSRAQVTLWQSMAALTDFHRQRTWYPLAICPIIDHDELDATPSFVLDPRYYQVLSDFGKANYERYLVMGAKLHRRYLAEKNYWMAMAVLPLGAKMFVDGQMGVRDAYYVAELRSTAAGANYEYMDQAAKILAKLKIQVPVDEQGR